MRKGLLRFLLVLVLAISASLTAVARQDKDPSFSDEERVTAVDVVVDFDFDRLRRWKSGKGAPRKLAPTDFEVLENGESRRVVAVEPGSEPWTIVVYFDETTTASYGLAWAADLLSRHVEELTRLGSVEVVVADPGPRTLGPPTRSAEDLSATLSPRALRLQSVTPSSETTSEAGRPSHFLALRQEFLAEALHPTPTVDPEEFARWVVTEEVRIGQAWQDRLLGALTERAEAEARRAVILISSGFDLRPGRFYLPAVDLTPSPQTAHLVQKTEALSQTLAAYGWTVIPLVPPPPDPEIRRGKRIGKWRMAPLGAAYEGERDAGAAEAHLELGMVLRKQGKLEDAADALEKAVHHFYGDPRTAKRQALALLELGTVQKELGKEELAARTFAEARAYDPAQATERLGPVVELLDAEGPLRRLAEETAGVIIHEDRELAKTLENLQDRVRLTYQVPGLASGELYPITVTYKRERRELQTPAWARSATPRTVAASRVRRMLGGELDEGDFKIRVFLEPAGRSGQITVTFHNPSAVTSGDEALLRITCAAGAPDVLGRVWHTSPTVVPARKLAGWSYSAELELTGDDSLVTVLVEDLYSGRWGAAVVSVRGVERER